MQWSMEIEMVKKVLCGIFISLFLITMSGCTSSAISNNPDPKEIERIADKAFKDLDPNDIMKEPDMKESIDGTTMQSMGESVMLDDLTRSDAEKYKTGEPGYITIKKTKRYGNITVRQAKDDLLKLMRNEAVNKKVGSEVQITSLLTDVMSATNDESYEQTAWSGFFKTTVSGVITEEKELVPSSPKNFDENGESFDLEMEYRFYVEPVTGRRDLEYQVDASLVNNMLKEGEDLVIKVTPTIDSYVYVFNLMADNNALLMFPNDYMQDNFIRGGETLTLPDPSIRKFVSFYVGTLPGQSLTSESIYVICSKQRVDVAEKLPRIGNKMKTFSSKDGNFIELQKWLTNIPLDQRTEKVMIYHVSKK